MRVKLEWFWIKKYQTGFSILNNVHQNCISRNGILLSLLSNCDCNIVYGQSSFQKQIFSHICQSWRRINCVSSNPVTLQIWRRITSLKKWRNNYVVIKSSMTKLSWFHVKKREYDTYPWNDNTRDGYFNAWIFE